MVLNLLRGKQYLHTRGPRLQNDLNHCQNNRDMMNARTHLTDFKQLNRQETTQRLI